MWEDAAVCLNLLLHFADWISRLWLVRCISLMADYFTYGKARRFYRRSWREPALMHQGVNACFTDLFSNALIFTIQEVIGLKIIFSFWCMRLNVLTYECITICAKLYKSILLWLNHSIASVRMRKIATKIALIYRSLQW